MAVFSHKSIIGRVGIGVIALATGWWLLALYSSLQLPSTQRVLLQDELLQSSATACGGLQERSDDTSACTPGASQAEQLARDESTAGFEGKTISAKTLGAGDDSSPSEDIRHIDIYDPSTWRVDPNDRVDLPDVVPIDVYDPSTWPIEINEDDESVDVDRIDLYDPDTWPSAQTSGAESATSVGAEIAVYDPATWPQAIGSAANGEAVVPIDPYDATTWPKD